MLPGGISHCTEGRQDSSGMQQHQTFYGQFPACHNCPQSFVLHNLIYNVDCHVLMSCMTINSETGEGWWGIKKSHKHLERKVGTGGKIPWGWQEWFITISTCLLYRFYHQKLICEKVSVRIGLKFTVPTNQYGNLTMLRILFPKEPMSASQD